jgi:hypothetical protein
MPLGNVSAHIQEVMESLFNLAKSHFAKWVWLYDIVLPPFLFGTMHHFMRAGQLKR